MSKKIFWVIFVFMAIIISIYPVLYFVIDRKFGLLSSKNEGLLNNLLWNISFYIHIIAGALALLVGWTQFSTKFREKNMNLHRKIGKLYVIFVLLSAISGIYIGFWATGGLPSALGFITLGVIWFFTTFQAYLKAKNKSFWEHEKLMIYSYAACFAAVTLRIWLPILMIIFGDFITAYQIVAWLCWLPNLVVAYFIIERLSKQRVLS